MATSLPPPSGTLLFHAFLLLLFLFSASLLRPVLILSCLVKVVAVAVFLALGFAFYVFFAPFVGKKIFQYVVMGIYTPLVSHFHISPWLFLFFFF